jgi:alkanesulfonate monooxygenase SsuD/methylene tetrahydromethanopterin reductase-like flavin-dependent oxidoreductase (luciferase family)
LLVAGSLEVAMTAEVRFGLVIPQLVPWPDMVERFHTAEALGFDSAWVVDHFVNPVRHDGRWFEGWTMLAALAARTSRIRLGTLVTSISFRIPAMLAREALTVDHISGGRLELGIGAGGQPQDHTMTGTEPWPPAERVDRFEEFVAAVDGLLRAEGEPVTYEGRYYQVRDALMTPGPVQRPRPPLTIGAGGRRMLRIVAAYADTWNTSVTAGTRRQAWELTPEQAVEGVARRNTMLSEACLAAGREPEAVRRSLLAGGGATPEDPWRSVEAFRDFVGRYREAGISEFLFYYPSRTEQAHGCFERIAREVMPALR